MQEHRPRWLRWMLSDWWSGGCGFDPRQVDTILSWRFDHEIFSMVILSLPLIQEGQLSVFGSHWGVQLTLSYSWTRPAILVAGKGRWGMFLFLLFLYFHFCSSFFPVTLFHLLCYLFYLFSPFLWEMTQNDPQGLTCRETNTINQFLGKECAQYWLTAWRT